MTLTWRQRRWIQKALDEGHLVVGGSDRSVPMPRLATCIALRDLGLLRLGGGRTGYEFHPTSAARQTISRYDSLTPGEHLSSPLVTPGQRKQGQ